MSDIDITAEGFKYLQARIDEAVARDDEIDIRRYRDQLRAAEAEKELSANDWKYEVANGDTVLGLEEWIEHQWEIHLDDERHPTHDDESRQAWDNELPLP